MMVVGGLQWKQPGVLARLPPVLCSVCHPSLQFRTGKLMIEQLGGEWLPQHSNHCSVCVCVCREKARETHEKDEKGCDQQK